RPSAKRSHDEEAIPSSSGGATDRRTLPHSARRHLPPMTPTHHRLGRTPAAQAQPVLLRPDDPPEKESDTMRSTRPREATSPRRRTAMLIALAASTSLLVACSTSDGNGDAPTDEPAQTPDDGTEEPAAEAWVPDRNLRLY